MWCRVWRGRAGRWQEQAPPGPGGISGVLTAAGPGTPGQAMPGTLCGPAVVTVLRTPGRSRRWPPRGWTERLASGSCRRLGRGCACESYSRAHGTHSLSWEVPERPPWPVCASLGILPLRRSFEELRACPAQASPLPGEGRPDSPSPVATRAPQDALGLFARSDLSSCAAALTPSIPTLASVPQTCWVCLDLRAFAHALLPACNVLPQTLPRLPLPQTSPPPRGPPSTSPAPSPRVTVKFSPLCVYSFNIQLPPGEQAEPVTFTGSLWHLEQHPTQKQCWVSTDDMTECLLTDRR